MRGKCCFYVMNCRCDIIFLLVSGCSSSKLGDDLGQPLHSLIFIQELVNLRTLYLLSQIWGAALVKIWKLFTWTAKFWTDIRNYEEKYIATCGVSWDVDEIYVEEWVERPAVNTKVGTRNSPEFDPCILRHSVFWDAADKAVLNKVNIYQKQEEKNWDTVTDHCL
jgi:hypothetical protein